MRYRLALAYLIDRFGDVEVMTDPGLVFLSDLLNSLASDDDGLEVSITETPTMAIIATSSEEEGQSILCQVEEREGHGEPGAQALPGLKRRNGPRGRLSPRSR